MSSFTSVVTIQCSRRGHPYALIMDEPVDSSAYDVHLAGPSRHGTGPILCGLDRFARGDDGRWSIGFSVGGGVDGPGVRNVPCKECRSMAGTARIRGMLASVFDSDGEQL